MLTTLIETVKTGTEREVMYKPNEINDYNNGVQKVYTFENGYGASVVCHDGSYGGKDGLWELAVLDGGGAICYHTPITQDVIGHQTDEQIETILKEIESL